MKKKKPLQTKFSYPILLEKVKSKASNFKALTYQKIEGIKNRIEAHWHKETNIHSATTQLSKVEKLIHYFQKEMLNKPSLILKIIFIFLVTFVLWASLFNINETVNAVGQVVPSKRLQVMGSIEAGIVKDIHVRDGDFVKKGQLLLKMDTTENESKLEELERDYHRNYLTVLRLDAQIKNKAFSAPDKIRKSFPDFAQQEEQMYKTAIGKYEKEKQILEEELLTKKSSLKQSQEKLKFLEVQIPILQEQHKITYELFQKKLYSKIRALDIERQKLEMQKEFSIVTAQIPDLTAQINQVSEKLSKLKYDYDTQNQKDFKDAQFKLDESESSKEIVLDRIKRQNIKAPISGIVREISVKTIGGVVKAGDNIVTIVPIDDDLLIEGKVNPQDIGFIQTGQSVGIRISTFDYTIYGRLTGRVENISADSIPDKEERTYFKVIVRSDKNYVKKNGKKYYLSPGMQAQLDIQTGNRSVMTYLLKPIIKSFSQSLTER